MTAPPQPGTSSDPIDIKPDKLGDSSTSTKGLYQELQEQQIKKDEEKMKIDPDEPWVPTHVASSGDYVTVKKEEEEEEEILDRTVPEVNLEHNDMFDDVDGPEYVDLSYEGIAEVDGVNCFVCEEFKIRQIPKPVIITRPLYQLFDCIESKHIILDPDYQREVVWDEGRAALLVNSILMGYFIPPIIFNCVQKSVRQSNGTKRIEHKRICVDGKQRLTSVWKFMTGQIGFFDSNTPQKKWYFCHPIVNGRHTVSNRNILPNAVKEFFKTQSFCCYEYDELTVDTEETMFQLVQRGIALTPAEKMRAMSTEWATFTKQYEDDYSLITNLSKQNRASGFRLVLTIFTMIQEVMGGKRKRSAAPTLQASPQALLRVLDDRASITPALKLKFKAVFDRYEGLVKASSTQLTTTRFKTNRDSPFDPAPIWLRSEEVDHVRTFSPLELVGSAILITVHGDKSTDEELLRDIQEMRHFLRVQHKDLRVNAQCWSTTWEFISNELDLRRSGRHPRAKMLTHEEARQKAKKAAAVEKEAAKEVARRTKKRSSATPPPSKRRAAAARAPSSPPSPPMFPGLVRRQPRAPNPLDSDDSLSSPLTSPSSSNSGSDTHDEEYEEKGKEKEKSIPSGPVMKLFATSIRPPASSTPSRSSSKTPATTPETESGKRLGSARIRASIEGSAVASNSSSAKRPRSVQSGAMVKKIKTAA